jgi:beta-lactamase class A
MIKKFLIIAAVFELFAPYTYSQIDSLKNNIEQILKTKDALIGISIRDIENGETLNINSDKHFPMQSVFKFHIALAVLDKVDKGELNIEQKIFISKNELLPNTWSPIREKYPDGNVKLTLAEIIKYTVSMSDNNGCDILLRVIGGPKEVEKYIHSLGIDDIAISANEDEMHRDWNVQFLNWTTPKAATDLLVLFYTKKVLSDSSYNFLLKTMIETSTGSRRIKGQLPEGTIVAHKTGSSGKNNKRITAAANDIGIVTLPNGNHFAISVFITNSSESGETNEKIISDIAKLAWDYFVTNIK